MRIEYRCPVDGCGKTFRLESKLRGHMAGTMQHDEAHRWENTPLSHTDLSAAKERVPGVTDF
jgi:hypothetical protein